MLASRANISIVTYRGDTMRQSAFLLAASFALGACAAHSGEPHDDATPAAAVDGQEAYS